jgi:hypothetical protein
MSLGHEMRRIEAAVIDGSANYDGCPMPPSDGDADQRMSALRPELYAITGVLAPLAVQQLIDLKDRIPPYGLPTGKIYEGTSYPADHQALEPRPNVTTFGDLYNGLNDAVQLTVNEFSFPSRYVPVAKRLNDLVHLAHEINPEEIRYKSPRIFLQAGLNTAAEMSVGALSGIRALAKTERKKTTRQDFIDIAGRSTRLILPIAAVNIDLTVPIRRTVKAHVFHRQGDKYTEATPYFNPNVLVFPTDPDAPDAYVDYVRPLDEFVDPMFAMRIGEIETKFDTLTCPALPKLAGSEVAIKTMWRHLTLVAADIKYGQK